MDKAIEVIDHLKAGALWPSAKIEHMNSPTEQRAQTVYLNLRQRLPISLMQEEISHFQKYHQSDDRCRSIYNCSLVLHK